MSSIGDSRLLLNRRAKWWFRIVNLDCSCVSHTWKLVYINEVAVGMTARKIARVDSSSILFGC